MIFALSFEEKTKPIPNNMAAISPETRAISILSFPLTKGCINAKMIKETPKLIAPLPSLLKPLNFIS